MVEGKQNLNANTHLSTHPLFSLKKESDLGIGAATGQALVDPFSSLFFCRKVIPSEPVDQRAVILPCHKRSGILQSRPPASLVQPNDFVRSSPVPVEEQASSIIIINTAFWGLQTYHFFCLYCPFFGIYHNASPIQNSLLIELANRILIEEMDKK